VGIRLAVDGHRLVARGRRLPPDLADRLRARKAELVALVTRENDPQNPQNAGGAEATVDCVDSVDGSSIPAPSLRRAVAGLSGTDRARLEAEVAAGDVLARLVLERLATSPGESKRGRGASLPSSGGGLTPSFSANHRNSMGYGATFTSRVSGADAAPTELDEVRIHVLDRLTSS
jgi:hypothetical protein